MPQIFFHFHNSEYPCFIYIPCKTQPKKSSGSGKEVEFVVFAIFSSGSHLGFLTCINFIILKPWSLTMLHVKFANNWCNGFREKIV